ncbi:endonuclease VII [Streptomyces phage Alone3]|nr:endonuclease VII [Streptomyces phage Alone3]
MPRHIHKLSNVDTENARAECAHCGPVAIKLKNNKSPRCMTAYKADRAKYEAKRDPVSPLHGVRRSEAHRLKQEYPCAICGESDTSKLHIDHDHVSGAVRGVLCQLCNTALGAFRDDPVRLTRAVAYLSAPPLKDLATGA